LEGSRAFSSPADKVVINIVKMIEGWRLIETRKNKKNDVVAVTKLYASKRLIGLVGYAFNDTRTIVLIGSNLLATNVDQALSVAGYSTVGAVKTEPEASRSKLKGEENGALASQVY
jgi:hypothetical protein